jgi:DNA-binding MarR family transcriptional regulator
MPKLSDTQLMLLSSATQRDGLVVLPAKLKGGAATKVVKPLLAHGLVNEVPSKPDMPAWRRDETEGQSYALVITCAGRKAINVEDEGEQPNEPSEKLARKSRRAAKPAGRKGSKRAAGDTAPRAGSKLALVIDLLGARGGATIDALVKATGWLPHTTRAALTGLRKRGYRIEKERRPDGKTTYRIVGGGRSGQQATARKGRKAR